MQALIRKLLGLIGLTWMRRPPFLAFRNCFCAPSSPRRHLGESHFRAVQNTAPAVGELRQSDSVLLATWQEIPGGHKWLHYFDRYAEVFTGFSGRPLCLLELGIYHGASLKLWHRYLPPASIFVGLAKDLADWMHAHHLRHQTEIYFHYGHPAWVARIAVPKISAQLDEIRSVDSMILIKKKVVTSLPLSVHL